MSTYYAINSDEEAQEVSEVEKHRFRFVCIPGRFPSPMAINLYEDAFEHWEKTWSDTFGKLEGRLHLYSDDFQRQDEICLLLSANSIIAMSLFSTIDLSLAAHRSLSCFRAIPPSVLIGLNESGVSLTTVGSYFSIAPGWRGRQAPYRIKELFFSMVVRRFLDFETPMMLGIMRRDRGMTKLGQRFGGQACAPDLRYHNVDVDLMSFQRDHSMVATLGKKNVIQDKLWEERFVAEVAESFRQEGKTKNKFGLPDQIVDAILSE